MLVGEFSASSSIDTVLSTLQSNGYSGMNFWWGGGGKKSPPQFITFSLRGLGMEYQCRYPDELGYMEPSEQLGVFFQ